SMVLDLASIPVRHIEHVDYLMSADSAQGLLYVIVKAGRDPGRMDRQTELKDGMRDDIQQPLRIVGEYIDDRESVVDPVIDHHLSCVMGCRQPANIRQAGVSTYQLIKRLHALQDPGDRFSYGSTPVLRGNSDIVRIGCLEGVHDDPVISGDDLSVENLKPLGSHRAGHF